MARPALPIDEDKAVRVPVRVTFDFADALDEFCREAGGASRAAMLRQLAAEAMLARMATKHSRTELERLALLGLAEEKLSAKPAA